MATTPERLGLLYRKVDLARSCGVEATILSPQECVERFPLLNQRLLLGALFVPSDGLAKAVRASEAMALEAISRGVEFRGNVTLVDIVLDRKRIATAHLSDGTVLRPELLICCAGIWANTIAHLLGLKLPLLAMQHPYIQTT